MKYQINIDPNSSQAKQAQIVQHIAGDIQAGTLKTGAKLPSINEFSRSHNVARDTIERAYSVLKRKGYIMSSPGKGYYVAPALDKELKIMILFPTTGIGEKAVYPSFFSSLGKNVMVDLHIYHDNLALFTQILIEHVGKYDYYVLIAPFTAGLTRGQYAKVLANFPAARFIILDQLASESPNTKNGFEGAQKDLLHLVKKELYPSII